MSVVLRFFASIYHRQRPIGPYSPSNIHAPHFVDLRILELAFFVSSTLRVRVDGEDVLCSKFIVLFEHTNATQVSITHSLKFWLGYLKSLDVDGHTLL